MSARDISRIGQVGCQCNCKPLIVGMSLTPFRQKLISPPYYAVDKELVFPGVSFVFRHWIFAVLSIFASASPVLAQELSDHFVFSPPAAWVEVLERPRSNADAMGRDINYLLVDTQYRHDDTTADRYFRYVEELETPNGVENNSSISIVFDPSYQNVTFHHLTRIRDGQRQDILDPTDFEIYRAEVDRDQLIYDRTLQASYVIPDVRVGDTLDYAFTISGKNPAMGPHFAGSFQHRYGVPVVRNHVRLLSMSDVEPTVRSFGGAEAPRITRNGNHIEYVWDARNAQALAVDDNTPPSISAYPTTYFTTFESWEEVGTYFAPYYDVAAHSSGGVFEIAQQIRSEHTTRAEQLRAALDYVQREIRYLGILFGEGGFIPRHPDEILEDRFGDCKDMTVLLLSILNELKIDATPFLVSFDSGDAVDAFLPSHIAFDHVIVSASLNGKTYYLDPTRGVQLGDIDNLQQGYFGKGVVIAPDSPGMIEASVPMPEFYKDITDTYDVVTETGAVLLTSVSTYYMAQADDMLAWYNSEGANAADRAFLQYFQNFHPGVEQLAPLEVKVDDIAGSVEITARYRISDAWTAYDNPDVRYFEVVADDLANDMPNVVGTARTSPFQIAHPIRTRQKLRFLLDDTWDIDDHIRKIDRPSLRFSNVGTFTGNIYTRELSYISKASVIAPENFRATMDALSEAYDQVGVELTMSDGEQDSRPLAWLSNVDNLEIQLLAWHAATVILAFAVALFLLRFEKGSATSQVFYPVSLLKFVTLSVVSYGVYPVFWSFMNWRWIARATSEDVSPGLRAFFMIFTNFGLFKRIANRSDKAGWFRIACFPLATVILVGWLGDYVYSEIDDPPDWLFHLGFVCMLAWIPVVAQVNRLNAEYPEVLIRNSKFGWPAIGMMLLFAPVAALMIYGSL